MTSQDPDSSFAAHVPFKIVFLPGYYVIEALSPPLNYLAISGCTLPTRYYGVFKSTWAGYYIDWSLCDYTQSFGVPSNPIPDYITLCNLLQSHRVPGPCDPVTMPGANPVNILYQYADTVHPGNNIISVIGNGDETALVSCGQSPAPVIQLETGASSIVISSATNSVTTTCSKFSVSTNDYELPLIPLAVKTGMIYYDSSTYKLSHGPLPATFTPTQGALYFNNVTTPSITSNIPTAQTTLVGSLGLNSTPLDWQTAAGGSGLQYVSGTPRVVSCIFQGFGQLSTTAQEIIVEIFQNGTAISQSQGQGYNATSNNITISTAPVLISLNQNDIIEIGFGRSTTNSTLTFTGTILLYS